MVLQCAFSFPSCVFIGLLVPELSLKKHCLSVVCVTELQDFCRTLCFGLNLVEIQSNE